jgi:DUF1680 family protein
VALGAAALLVASGVAFTAPIAATAASGLDAAKVLDLSFDGSLADASAGGNPVAMTQGAAEYVAGISGQALNLSGDDALTLGTSPTLQPENLTLSFWFKPNGAMTGEEVFTWNKAEYNSEGWYLTSENDGTPLALSIGRSDGQPYKVSVQGQRNSFFPTDAWTHVVVTYDKATKAVTFYRNGERQVSTVVVGVGVDGNTGVLGSESSVEKTIGYNGTVYRGAYLRGAIDDWTLYDAAASTTDVVALEQKNNPGFDPSAVAQKGLATVSVPTTAVADFGLTTTTSNGSDLTWTSSEPGVIAINGDKATVVRPSAADATVTLTASASYGGSSATSKTFTVTVPQDGENASLYLDDTQITEVLVTDPYLQNSRTKMVDWLLELDPKRFLYSFDQLAGIATDAQPYGGWESPTGPRFQGHFTGSYLYALAQAYSTEADAGRKQQLLDKLTLLVEGLRADQEAYAQKDPANTGYVAPFPTSVLPNGADGLIVPFYNLHKVLAGLLKAQELAPADISADALTVASGFGTWIENYSSSLDNPARVMAVEYGGMNEALYDLYAVTKNDDHKRAAEHFDEVTLFRELAAGNDVLAGLHANATIPKIIGAMKRYTLFTNTPELYQRLSPAEKDDLEMYHKAAENFWTFVSEDRSYAGGGNSYSEHFQQPGTLYQFATNGETNGYGENSTVEGCNEFNMLRLTRALFQVNPDVKYADYYENTYINTILASQNRDTGMMTYFQPQTAGYAKVFGARDGEFWCDHASATESFTKLGDSIYFRKGSSVWVNMFRSSTWTSEPQNLKLTQVADVPNTDQVSLTVESIDGGSLPQGTTLRLRVPDWSQTPTLKVNGQTRDTSARESGYLVIPIAAGDQIDYTIPATVSVDANTENPDWVAFRYGPVLLSTELSRVAVDKTYVAGILVRMGTPDKSLSNNVLVSDVADFKADISDNVVRLQNAVDNNGHEVMKFALKNVDDAASKLVFEPYYSMYNARYALYMNLIEPDSDAAQAMILKEKQQQRIDETTTDSLTSFDANNSEAGKNYKTNLSSVGVWRGMPYRDAQADPAAFFSYDMAIDLSAAKRYLGVRYYGGDAGRTFDVYVNDNKLKSERVNNSAGNDQWYIQYDEIPEAFTADTASADRYKRDSAGKYVLDEDGNKIPIVTVRFQSNGSSFVGGVYGVFTSTRTAYDTASALTGLSFPDAAISPAFSGATTAYTVSVPQGATAVTFDADPAVASGLVYADGILIDDTKPRTVQLAGTDPTTLKLEAFAQDHLTKTAYTISIVHGTAPTTTPSPTATPEPTVTPTATPEPTGTPTVEPTASPTSPPTVSPTAQPTASPAPAAAPAAAASTSQVERGGVVRVTVSGLKPGEQVTAELQSDPIRVTGIPAADAAGRVAFDVRIPADLPTGTHHIVVRAADGTEIARLPIMVAAKGTLAATGAQAPLAGGFLAALLLLAGAGTRVLRRPRRA